MGDGDWSELDYDLLGEIVLKLDAIEDFIYFSVVCCSWNHASSLVKRKWKSSMPCLLLAENHKETPSFRRNIFSLNSDRCYQLSLPDGARYWGSVCGWIVTLDHSLEINIVNPFTNDRIQLPPQTTIPHQDWLRHKDFFISKAIVVKPVEGGRDDDLIVLAIHTKITNRMRCLSFARPGDQTWTSIVPPWPMERTQDDDARFKCSHSAVNVVCNDRLILILYEDASLGYLHILDLRKQSNVKAMEFLPSPKELKSRFRMSMGGMYVVESYGNLFMVHRIRRVTYIEDPNCEVDVHSYKTEDFKVFKLNFKMKKWEQVGELGDVAFFVGDSHSMSVRVSESGNCMPNCIYFTDDNVDEWDMPAKFGGRDMGVFHLDNKKFHELYRGDDVHSYHHTSFWFMPHF